MPDGLGPTETLTAFERYDGGGYDDADDGGMIRKVMMIYAIHFRSAPNWNELRKGADLAMLLVNGNHCKYEMVISNHQSSIIIANGKL